MATVTPLDSVRAVAREAAISTRPTIQVRPALNAMTREALDAIRAMPDLEVYVRARMLVTVARDGSDRERWLVRPPGGPVIVPIEQAAMLSIMDTAAEWTRHDARKKADVPCMPPAAIATQLLVRTSWPLPYLEAVIETPTIRGDGTILDTPGYDEVTGLLYAPEPGVEYPAVPDRPSGTDVQGALDALLEPVCDFPFLAASDRAAYLAAVLTLIARHCIDGPTPMIAVRAPTPGTGKGLLTSIIGLIGTGREPAVMVMADGDELRKRVTAIALTGAPVVLLDDVSGSLGSGVLAALLTAREWDDRILGRTEMVRLPLRTVWLATGANLGFRRTLGRRVIPIDLDARCEQPEDRTGFRHADVVGFVRARRPELVAAALTILRAFHMVGRPRHGGARMGSFEGWDDAIRSAVVWAARGRDDLADPAATDDPTMGRGRIRSDADDDLAAAETLLGALERAYPDREPFRAADALRKADDDRELRDALDTAAAPRAGTKATVHSLGARLREWRGRPMGGRMLDYARPYWRVESAR